MSQLEGKIAIVTGAARGLGRAYAEAMAGQGAAVLACDINSCDDTVAAILAAGGRAAAAVTDISSMFHKKMGNRALTFIFRCF